MQYGSVLSNPLPSSRKSMKWMRYAIILSTSIVYSNSFFQYKVKFTDELEQYFASKKASTLYTLHGPNSDSGNEAKPAYHLSFFTTFSLRFLFSLPLITLTYKSEFPGIEKFKVDKKRLFADIVACRVIKSPKEIEVCS